MKIIISSRSSALPYFDQDEVEKLTITKNRPREKLILMPINHFLILARRIAGGELHDEKTRTVNSLLDQGKKFNSLPFLKTEVGSTYFQVTGHEGRHRAMALKALGCTDMPVRIISETVLWSEQNTPSSVDYIPAWPSQLRGEHGNCVPFPFSREQAPENFK